MTTWETQEQLLLIMTTLTVTGTGTTFGVTGGGHTEAQVGDVIHFGHRDATDGGISTYFGSYAVIVGVASTSQLTIGSTAGLHPIRSPQSQQHIHYQFSVLFHSLRILHIVREMVTLIHSSMVFPPQDLRVQQTRNCI